MSRRTGNLTNRITIRIGDELLAKLETFAAEFGIRAAEGARLAAYLLMDQYESQKDSLEYYDTITRKIDEMWIRDAEEYEDEQTSKQQMYSRLARAVDEGLIVRDYAAPPQTMGLRHEAEFIYRLIQELDRGDITGDMFRRRIRHYVFNGLIARTGGDELEAEEISRMVAEGLKKILG